MSECINMGTEFPKYYQFPEFLIRLPVSQTAKLVYGKASALKVQKEGCTPLKMRQ